ncbi:hypothetical protein NO2_0616 [Candidatus Termititenax persephonae]|uniref:Uncharacterized protein n=1 Tax=Candidatus Termititenax persephonae TaxID=2218525 RepID=A0A388TI51_9BACT|nr:hypothetical protein NO2_0616 [Candidatus Termititenax persephonae]
MLNPEQTAIAETLFANAAMIAHGMASVELKIHGGHIVGTTHSLYKVTKGENHASK